MLLGAEKVSSILCRGLASGHLGRTPKILDLARRCGIGWRSKSKMCDPKISSVGHVTILSFILSIDIIPTLRTAFIYNW